MLLGLVPHSHSEHSQRLREQDVSRAVVPELQTGHGARDGEAPQQPRFGRSPVRAPRIDLGLLLGRSALCRMLFLAVLIRLQVQSSGLFTTITVTMSRSDEVVVRVEVCTCQMSVAHSVRLRHHTSEI